MLRSGVIEQPVSRLRASLFGHLHSPVSVTHFKVEEPVLTGLVSAVTSIRARGKNLDCSPKDQTGSGVAGEDGRDLGQFAPKLEEVPSPPAPGKFAQDRVEGTGRGSPSHQR